VGTGVIVSGQREQVPGLSVENWLDNPVLRLRRHEDFRSRKTSWIRQVIIHTTKGIPGGNDQREQVIRPGLGPSQDAGQRCARWWTKSAESAGAHLIVDHDGEVFCCVDLEIEAAQHARHANDTSIGIEIYQGRDAEMYEGQLEATVRLVDYLTRRFGIQRQVPNRYVGPVARLMDDVSDVVGVLGHRDLANNRGRGDPGSKIFYLLYGCGYEDMNYEVREDLEIWRRRQRDLGLAKADGVPGPQTAAALRALGRPHGLWVRRPDDDPDDASSRGPVLVG
jgi:hypothetical protein